MDELKWMEGQAHRQNCFYFFLNNFYFSQTIFPSLCVPLVPFTKLFPIFFSSFMTANEEIWKMRAENCSQSVLPFMLEYHQMLKRLRNKINYKLFEYLSQQRVSKHTRENLNSHLMEGWVRVESWDHVDRRSLFAYFIPFHWISNSRHHCVLCVVWYGKGYERWNLSSERKCKDS